MSDKDKKKKQTGLGLAVWLLLMLIIVIVALVKWEEIKENADKAGLTTLVEKNIKKDDSQKTDVSTTEKKSDTKNNDTVIHLNLKNKENSKKNSETANQNTVQTQPELKSKTENTEKKESAVSNQVKKEESVKKTAEEIQPKKLVTSKSVTEEKNQSKSTAKTNVVTKVETSTVTVPSTVKTKIYFVSDSVPIVRKEVTKNVKKDTPLMDALNMLLAGPSLSEVKNGYRSLIPQGTRLLSVSVKNGVASMSFSEEFQFNQYGTEGSLAQLMQVVYTASEFSTVDSVQILIEGQKRDYLTEGVWIGSPLSRNSF
ncbi:GerMN domain-containing protein [Treponema sp.]|uniref:GerMN domain-containing protein n=1 Tax=Treponema sp. TaxID=166 RepID=UPI00388D1CF0